MSDIAKILGQRIRRHRTAKGLSQEKLAEFSGCHPTYIGQIERGEKNATIESIEKIASALNVSLSTLFEKIGAQDGEMRNIPLECYELISAKSQAEQEQILRILIEIDKYKRIDRRRISLNNKPPTDGVVSLGTQRHPSGAFVKIRYLPLARKNRRSNKHHLQKRFTNRPFFIFGTRTRSYSRSTPACFE